MSNPKTSFLIPPYSGNAGDGFASQPEPKSLAEELAEESSLILSSVQRDIITFSVDDAINNTGHDLRVILNVRHNLPWKTIDRLIAEMQPLVGPAIERAKAEQIKAEKERAEHENLVALFNAFGLQIQMSDDGGYVLSGLTESQLREIADSLAANEGVE